MTKQTTTNWGLAVALLLLGAGCGGSDDGTPADTGAPTAADSVPADDGTPADENDQTDEAGNGAGPGFGNLIDGEFTLTGATEVDYRVGDEGLAFRTVGGCQADTYGFGVHVTDAAGTMTYAMFSVEGQEDLSGGVTGEFQSDLEATVLPGGDMTLGERFSGPVTMVLSEHDTGGADFDLNERRMSVQVDGTAAGESGDVDVAVAYRWVMGCP